MRKTKESLYLAAIRLHQKIRGGLPKNWHEKNFTDTKHENDQVKKILKEINKSYDSRSLFEIASEAHQKAFGSLPFELGEQATDDATALQILLPFELGEQATDDASALQILPPFEWGEQATDDATALQILKSIVDGIPYNETQNEYDPITPRWRKFLN
tara:strand:+ start:151 stop:624 length:474 start_codon:yes stop_codon:yes gene_type:complete